MKITAIIVNYFTGIFLPPLLEILHEDELLSEIIVADNSRETGLADLVRKYPKVRLLTLPENLGFAAATNAAAKNTKSDWWLVINPDTLPDRNLVEKLVAGAEKTNSLVAGPRFYWDDDKTFRLPPALGYSWLIHNAMQVANYSAADARLFSFDWALRHERFWNNHEPFCESFLSGGCLLVKNDKTFFIDGKIFDERFFLYYEDTDLCMRAVLENKNIVCVPDAEVVHYWNQSPLDHKGKFVVESGDKFLKKYYPEKWLDLAGFSSSGLGQSGLHEDFDLGEVSTSPVFKYQKPEGNCFFEFGLNPFFVPFAQAVAEGQEFQISWQIWQKLQPGYYFSRIRNSFNQTLAIWKWKKL